jgi:hypothetical protein
MLDDRSLGLVALPLLDLLLQLTIHRADLQGVFAQPPGRLAPGLFQRRLRLPAIGDVAGNTLGVEEVFRSVAGRTNTRLARL